MREDGISDTTEADAIENAREALKRIEQFSERVRSGEVTGYSGKALKNTLILGIGGSF